MKRPEALELLGLSQCRTELTPEIVQEAFRAAVWKYHPDAQGESVGPKTGELITTAKEARDYLLKNLSSDADLACKLCVGIGMVRSAMGWRQCVACSGSGVKR